MTGLRPSLRADSGETGRYFVTATIEHGEGLIELASGVVALP